MPVGDLGPDDVVTADPNDSVADVVDDFRSEDVGAVVVTDDQEPVGLVTDRDVALSVGQNGDIADEPVESVMSDDPVTLQEDEEAMEISRAIEDQNVRRIPVVDDEGNLTGLVTFDDLVATIGEQLDNVADTIESQSPDYSP